MLLLVLLGGVGVGGYFLVQHLRQEGKGGVVIDSTGKEVTDKAGTDKEQFIRIVQQNADDPAGLEIVVWGEKQDNLREVKFRCKRIGVMRTGRLKTAGPPVMLEDATIKYQDGKISEVFLERTFQFWHPQK